MTTLVSRLGRASSRPHAITFITGDTAIRVPWAQLHEEARATAAALQARGIAPRDHIALLGPTTRALVTAIQASWLAGATVVVLPLPMRLGSLEEFVHQTRRRIVAADARMVLVDPDLAAFVDPQPGDPPMVRLDELTAGRASAYEEPKINEDDLAVLQFTSGSTADPKGVMLPHRTILANLDGAAASARLDPEDDVLVSWLPLYHDMGLIGTLTLPMITGMELVLAAPQDFLAQPGRWIEWMSTYGGTATAGPNFSYALAARALRRAAPGSLDLSRWRIALNGAEPVNPATVDAFCEAAGPHGFRPGASFCAFGMAELAIAGTFPEPMSGMRIDTVDRASLEQERYAAPVHDRPDDDPTVRRFALLGRPVAGLEVRVCDPDTGRTLGEREVGELEIRGTSVTPGYYKRPDATEAAFRGDWLRTGDLAYLVGGELVLCGRIKDVIIVGGRNVFPEDVERAAEMVEGVRAGNVIAFGVEGHRGKESLIVVAETKADGLSDLRTAVASQVSDAVGLPPEVVVLVAPGTLPKTSSGKLQRSLCKQRYLGEELQLV
ncbi:MAG TPA: AMP-binding protein [Acidimicrobiales bacterium]|nr:AMP-binding protein [Acidimicrobiales bacterium]